MRFQYGLFSRMLLTGSCAWLGVAHGATSFINPNDYSKVICMLTTNHLKLVDFFLYLIALKISLKRNFIKLCTLQNILVIFKGESYKNAGLYESKNVPDPCIQFSN